MQIQGDVTFDAAPDVVWRALLDPAVISECIPGCQELTEVDEDTYDAHLRIGVGAVSGTYMGRLRIQDKVMPSHYRMEFEGEGSQGFVRGTGGARFKGENGTTVLSYDCEVEVGGLIASVGQRVLSGVGQFLVGQMFRKLSTCVGNGGER